MKIHEIISAAGKVAVAVLLFQGCQAADLLNEDQNDETTPEEESPGEESDPVLDSSDASALASSASVLFGDLGGGGAQALHAEGHSEEYAEENGYDYDEVPTWDFCAEDPGVDGITFDNHVTAGHYGRRSAGKEIEADLDCDTSSAETTFKSWRLAEVRIMVCDDREVSINGNGIVRMQGYPGTFSAEIYGQFEFGGVTAHCDMRAEETGFTAECEDENGNEVVPDEVQTTCHETTSGEPPAAEAGPTE